MANLTPPNQYDPNLTAFGISPERQLKTLPGGIVGNTSNPLAQVETPDYLTKNLSEANPLPWQQYLSPDIGQGTVQGQIKRAFDNNGAYYDETLKHGLDPNQGTQLIRGASQSPLNQSPQMAALTRRAEKNTQSKISDINQNYEINKSSMLSNEYNRTAQILSKDQALKISNFKEQYDFETKRRQLLEQWKAAQEAAEASIWSSVASIGGSLIGAGVGALL